MTRVRVKGFKIFRDRHGKMRCYHRKSGTPINSQIGTAEFFAECARISALAEMTAQPRPGTLGMLIIDYRRGHAFQDLAPRTRSDYQRIFDYLKPIGDTPLSRFNAPLVVRIRDAAAKKHGRRMGNYVKQVISLLFTWGIERGHIRENPAKGIKNIRRPKGAPRANRPWSDAERFAMLDAAPWHLRVPIALGMYAGLREGDALALTKSAYDGTSLEIITRKTGQRVWWPVPQALKIILDSAPAHSAVTIAANSYGKPWTESGFRSSFGKLRARLEESSSVAAGLTFHGLRHTVATILREEGFDARTIADALGQKTEDMARYYSRDADLRRSMTGVVHRLDVAENERRSKFVKPSGKSVKPID